MTGATVHRKFADALEGLVAEVRNDRAVLAAILGGSLSHDKVWDKSDIDLVLVTVDEKRGAADEDSVAICADGVNVHAMLMTRAEFRQVVEGSLHNSFLHSFLAKGRLLYSHDPTIADLFGTLRDIGNRDTRLQLLRAATGALPPIYKAHKWFVTRRDLDYTALWILYAATSLARMEVIRAGLIADREVIPQALGINPAFFKTIYTDLLNSRKSQGQVRKALDAVDGYMEERVSLFDPVIECLREAGEPRSASELEHHFRRNFDVGGVTTACEYLADRGRIGRASRPVRLTRKSSIQVQELAFFYLDTHAAVTRRGSSSRARAMRREPDGL
jgi:uncharacterized protein